MTQFKIRTQFQERGPVQRRHGVMMAHHSGMMAHQLEVKRDFSTVRWRLAPCRLEAGALEEGASVPGWVHGVLIPWNKVLIWYL